MEAINFADQMFSDYFNIQPSQVKARANIGVEYHKRYLYQLIYSRFKFTIPKQWGRGLFRRCVFAYGSIGVIYTKKFGWIAYPYSILKRDMSYGPAEIQIVNRFLDKPKRGIVGLNAGVVHILDDYFGLDDLVTHYATKLAACDKALDINLMNANVTKSFEVASKKQAAEIKEAYEEATKGNPLVVLNKEVSEGRTLTNFFGDVKSNYIGLDVLETKRTIINEFLTKIGINNANVTKRERLNSDEVNANNEETKSLAEIMLENISSDFDKINAISDLGLKVELRDIDGREDVDIWEE